MSSEKPTAKEMSESGKYATGRDETSLRAVENDTSTQDTLGDHIDPVLSAKLHLVNVAINEIGWTTFHFKLLFLTGFGFAVDSLIAFLQSVAAEQAYLEIGNGGYRTASTMGIYAGAQAGALFWGFGADMIGRRIAFNITLFIASMATIVAGAAPNWIFFCSFVALLGFGAGGNLVLDPTVMLEFVPTRKQWVVTALAGWWGVGQASAGFIAWGYYSRSEWSCDGQDCTWQNNKAWRLIMFTGGAVVFVMSILRIIVTRLPETPKHLVSVGENEKAVAVLQSLAAKHNRECSVTVEMLEACGPSRLSGETQGQSKARRLGQAIVMQVKGLFKTRKMGVSTVLIWLSWTFIGLGYSLFFLYLPALLRSRVPGYSPSFTETYRDYTITNVCSIFGPLIAAGLVESKYLGRRYTMAIGAIVTAAFFFGYTAIKTPTQNLALSSSIAVCINLYYGTLYAYTAEVFPSAQRGTGNGIAVYLNRLMGLLSAVIAVTTDITSVTPLYLSAGVFICLAIISATLPFEPFNVASS